MPAHRTFANPNDPIVQQSQNVLPTTSSLNLSTGFIPNTGQTRDVVRFLTRNMGGITFFTPSEVVLSLRSPEVDEVRRSQGANRRDPNARARLNAALRQPPTVARLSFDGANPSPTIVGIDQLESKVNYLTDSDPAKWQTDLPTFGGIVYQQLYPGIDLHYEITDSSLKSTYTIASGANPTLLRWRYTGAESVQVDTSGNLVIKLAPPRGRPTEPRSLTEQAPIAWQDINGQRIPVAAAYSVAGDGSVSFTLGQYDPAYELIIDPVLSFSSYLGGSNTSEAAFAVAVDNAQNIYITGYTFSTNFPLANAFDNTSNISDAFVTKIQNGVIVYSTYLGGSANDSGEGITVDGSGNIYVIGGTDSTNFPIQNAYDSSYGGGANDVFVTKLDPSQSGVNQLRYSTYLGGGGNDYGSGIAVSGARAYAVGMTSASGYPTKNAYDTSFNGGSFDGFVTRLDTSLSGAGSLLYSTYLGGSNTDQIGDVAVDSSGKAYLVGSSISSNFPTKNAYDATSNGNYDAVVTKMDLAISGAGSLLYSTYIGGSSDDNGSGVAVDSSNRAYVTGTTLSTNFPTKFPYTTPTKNGSSSSGNYDVFLAGFNPATSGTNSRLYSTYIGGSLGESGVDIGAESDGRVTIAGHTASSDFLVETPYPMQSSFAGAQDAFVAQFGTPPSSGNLEIKYSSYLGGTGDDLTTGMAVDSSGRAYIVGETNSINFPTVKPFQATRSGGVDAFVAKVFPEHFAPPCRWPHTAGATTTLTYKWETNLSTPGTPWRNAFDAALTDWNAAATKMRFAFSSSGSITMRLYTDTEPGAVRGGATATCSGSTTTGYAVRVNDAFPVSKIIAAHEIGHSIGIGHIATQPSRAIMYRSPDTSLTTIQPLDIELVNLIYP
jgi:hypothetical protein